MNMFKNVFSLKEKVNYKEIANSQSIEIADLKRQNQELKSDLIRAKLSITPSRKIKASDKPHCQAVLEHLRSGKSITGLVALDLFGCYRLSDAIHKLRKRGHNIETTMKEHDGVQYGEYNLVS